MAAILFVMKYPLHCHENLKAKFDGQMAAARALGNEVYCIGWNMEGMWLVGESTPVRLRRNRFTKMPIYSHTKIFVDLMAAVRQVLCEKKIDILYLRYMPTFGGAVKTMRMLKAQGGKLALEYPTYPKERENRRSLLRRPIFAYTDHVLSRIHPMVDLYTLIGEKCEGMLDGRPAMNIVNGIFVDNLPLHKPNPQTETINLLALASMAGWHGYDRILRSLSEYQGAQDVRIHLVGADGDGSLAAWKELAVRLGIAERVTFHGALYGEALSSVVQICDIGIGSLAMFRFGLSQGMTLKLREYMARGLPFVYAVDDPSIPSDERFRLRVPNDESAIDMGELVAFAVRAKHSEAVPSLMRAYAKAQMSWESVMRSVLERLDI